MPETPPPPSTRAASPPSDGPAPRSRCVLAGDRRENIHVSRAFPDRACSMVHTRFRTEIPIVGTRVAPEAGVSAPATSLTTGVPRLDAPSPAQECALNSTSFAALGLSPGALQALDRAGFEQPTPIQAAAIPPA